MTKIRRKINNIWVATREYGDLAGAGGVKDVARQLAEALAGSGRKISVVLPLYGFMHLKNDDFTTIDISFDVDMSYVQEERREFVTIRHKKTNGVDLYLVDSPRFREKKGVYTYTAADTAVNPLHRQGDGHFDYFAMNLLLQKAAFALIICLDQKPDIIHCHDGHTALLPVLIHEQEGLRHYFRKTGCVVTIHNAGIGYHQEVADLSFAQAITGLPERVIKENLLQQKFDPLLAVAGYAEINTVSENYARELRETNDDELTGLLGHELMKRGVKLEGITNGINPADFTLPSFKKPSDKAACKKALWARLQKNIPAIKRTGTLTPNSRLPLFTFIGRFSTQKGVDKMISTLKNFLPIEPDFQILILGSGQKDIEEPLIRLAQTKKYRGRICVLRGFAPGQLANLIYAAGDFFLIPSKYEPCGLTDYIAQLFGNLPIVHHVGGLVKVVDGETGFAFHEHSAEALQNAMTRALGIFKSKSAVTKMQKSAVAAINKKYTWEKVTDHYLDLYERAVAHQ